jgi:hypothetical protein
MKKNEVYLIKGKKYLVLLADKELACLCPIIPHKKDSGYKTILSKCVIHSTDLCMQPKGTEKLGFVKNLNYYKKLK